MKTNRQDAGWISTLVALVALIVVGFLCGALAGFLWEEPGLVLAYLSGKTEPVEWNEQSRPSDPEKVDVAASPRPALPESAEPDASAKLDAETAKPAPPPADEPLGAEPAEATEVVREKPIAPAPPPAAKPADKKPVISPSRIATPAKPAPTQVAMAPAGRFSIQVGAFADRASADKLASRLRARGYDTFVKADGEAAAKRFRVRVGPVKERTRAEQLAAKLAKGEKLPTWILDESKG
jgi:DedD protein